MKLPAAQVVVRDIYKERDIGRFTGSFEDIVEAHGVLALRLTPIRCIRSLLSWLTLTLG